MYKIDIISLNKKLWYEKVYSISAMSEDTKNAALSFGNYYVEDIEFLYEILKSLEEDCSTLQDSKNGVTFHKQDESCILIFMKQQIELNPLQMKEFIVSLIMIMEEILPLGSTVELKKQYFDRIIESKVEKIEIVITYRFLSKKGAGIYFPYAGVVYPTGMLGRKEVLYFTPRLIENVVHRGYEDKKEWAYTYQMKREYLLQKNMISVGFADKKTRDEFLEIRSE